jgi:hypothetical protein
LERDGVNARLINGSFDLTPCWNRAVLWRTICASMIKNHNAVQNDCSKQLAELENKPSSALRNLWQELIGNSAPTRLRREVLIPILGLQASRKGIRRPESEHPDASAQAFRLASRQ